MRVAREAREARRRAEDAEHPPGHVERVGLGVAVGSGDAAADRVDLVARGHGAIAVLEGVDREHRDTGARRGLGAREAGRPARVEAVVRDHHRQVAAVRDRRDREDEGNRLARPGDDATRGVATHDAGLGAGALDQPWREEGAAIDLRDRSVHDRARPGGARERRDVDARPVLATAGRAGRR